MFFLENHFHRKLTIVLFSDYVPPDLLKYDATSNVRVSLKSRRNAIWLKFDLKTDTNGKSFWIALQESFW